MHFHQKMAYLSMVKSEEGNDEKSDVGEKDSEWDEITMVVELSGVMDTEIARDAIRAGDCAVRRANSADPLLQIANTLYTAKWVPTLGTDLIFKHDGSYLKFVTASDIRLKADKALVTRKDEK
ncbi:hypothetical protein AB6A40_009937 [Gnathostoma spinigerum]|uniref:Transcription factor TFIIIC triple barrel domain-containing protein n=1 Tax=Gnathostoma spinigerum TaxID=75299 RepID=A0ABD6ETE1_9BILA